MWNIVNKIYCSNNCIYELLYALLYVLTMFVWTITIYILCMQYKIWYLFAFLKRGIKKNFQCNSEGIDFFPMVIATFGGWHKNAAEVISKLARQLESHTEGDSEEVYRHLFQRLNNYLEIYISIENFLIHYCICRLL